MNPRPRHVFLLCAAAAAATAALGLRLVLAGRQTRTPLPAPPSADAQATRPAPEPEPGPAALAALVPDAEGGRALARRFRLAGTLLGVGNATAEKPLAVLDDRTVARQILVRLGDEIAPGIRLAEVGHGEAVLEGATGRVRLTVERATPAMGDGEGDSAGGSSPVSAGATARFGGREVFPGRWEFSRDTLLDYYTELRREPERLVAVFDSLEPLWKDGDPSTRIIEGYQLNVQGEADFFEAMGMRQGDIVRAVNSVEMANRVRAEAFITAFVLGEMDTFAVDIERDGHAEQFVYVTQ